MENQLFFKSSEQKKRSIGLIHRVYLTFLKNSRHYLASTKTKSEIRGGGKKPWKQKGTGQARAGSTRSPLWVGGGVIFGPKPKIVQKKVNKKERKLAILSAFYLKKNRMFTLQDERFDSLQMIKTKDVIQFLKEFNLLESKKVLFILPKPNRNFWLATRNLKNVEIASVQSFNLVQILEAEHLFLSNSSFQLLNQSYGSQSK